ncbi:MAG: hypothetical protein E4H36_05580 [Spirochaetales bacterium]|nr:MAG: hypothetical protein E4H36_05580 [Spirochaetales bacterium]
MKKKFDAADIDKVLKKIRGLYNDYIIRYTKPLTLKEKFEIRYLQALGSSMDMETFLTAEADVILTLIRREEEKKSARAEDAEIEAHEQSMSEKADLIILENKRKIAKYPDLHIHSEASYELKKLFGALKLLEEYHWPVIDKALRLHSREFAARTRPATQTRITDMCTVRTSGVPLVLGKYQTLLDHFEKNIREIEIEEKRLMLEASFLLHDLSDIQRKLLGMETLDEELYGQVETSSNFVDNILRDFRFTQLKPKRAKE